MVEQRRIRLLLKKLMKENSLTYESMARKLGVSTATIKRRLNNDDLTLAQLAELCGVLNLSLYELIEMSKEQELKLHLFTEEQEEVLSRNLQHILILRGVLRGWNYQQIKQDLQVTDRELRASLRAMEKVELLNVMPGDRINALVSFPFRWRSGGKLEKAYNERIIKSVTAQSKKLQREKQSLNPATTHYKTFEFLLTPRSLQDFCQDLAKVYDRYRGLSEMYLKERRSQAEIVSGILMVDNFSLWQGDDSRSTL